MLFVSELLEFSRCLNFSKPSSGANHLLDFLNVSNYSNKRNTRSTSNGMIPFYRCRTKTMENSLSCKIVKCFNFLMSNKLLPDKNRNVLSRTAVKIFKGFQKKLHFRQCTAGRQLFLICLPVVFT